MSAPCPKWLILKIFLCHLSLTKQRQTFLSFPSEIFRELISRKICKINVTYLLFFEFKCLLLICGISPNLTCSSKLQSMRRFYNFIWLKLPNKAFINLLDWPRELYIAPYISIRWLQDWRFALKIEIIEVYSRARCAKNCELIADSSLIRQKVGTFFI